MNSIIYQPKALKQLRKIQAQDSAAIRAKVDDLANMPDCVNVISLTNHKYTHRLRVGNYRVLFNFDGDVQVVSIEEVKKEMKAHTNHNQPDLGNAQVIRGMDGLPEFVVLPVAEYLSLTNKKINLTDGVPNQVVNMVFDNDWTPIRAWREHLGLTQEEMARRLGISQPTYSAQESSTTTRMATREKIAAALGIKPRQLDF